MEIDRKKLKQMIADREIDGHELRVMDSGMNVSLSSKATSGETVVLHAKRGGVRLMSPQTALRFASEVLGADEIKVVLKNDRK